MPDEASVSTYCDKKVCGNKSWPAASDLTGYLAYSDDLLVDVAEEVPRCT